MGTPEYEYDFEPPRRPSWRSFAQRGPSGKGGWLTAFIVTAGSVIGQLLQVRAGDARTLEQASANVALQTKLDGVDAKINDLRDRVTKLEVKMEERTRKP